MKAGKGFHIFKNDHLQKEGKKHWKLWIVLCRRECASESPSSISWSVTVYAMPCAIGCSLKNQALCNIFCLSYCVRVASSYPIVMHASSFQVSLWGTGYWIKSFSLLLFLFNSSLLPSICCFYVSSKIFLPLTNFKYSLRVLSTIAYKHLEIIESQRADKKGSSDRA